MSTSLFKIAEQCKSALGGKERIQDLLAAAVDCYSGLVRKSWWENKNANCHEVDGAFIITFPNIEPILDLNVDQYYIVIPSSYLQLPEESGIISVGFAKGQDKNFVLTGAGTWARLMSIKAGVMSNRQLYYVENTKMYFPKMTNTTNGNIMLKFALALDNIDPDAELNIPRSIIVDIVNIVVQRYAPVPPKIDEKIS